MIDARSPGYTDIAAAEALGARGWAIIRNAASPDDIAAVRETIAAHFEEQLLSGKERTRYGGVTLTNIMEARPQAEDVLRLVASSSIKSAVESFFGERIAIPLHHALFRHYYASDRDYDRVSPFHQDVVGVDPRARITSWWPLDRCGIEAPGLEIVGAKFDALISPDQGGKDKDFGISADRLLPEYAGRLVHPEFQPGDVALFLNLTPHRTFVTPQMHRSRMSFECRYAPVSALRADESQFHRL